MDSSSTSPVALAFEGAAYTRGDLTAMAAGLAAGLQLRGVRAGDRVALMSSNRPEFVAALWAVWGVGASVVLMSSSWKQAEVRHALTLTGAGHGVGDSTLLAEAIPMLSLDDPRRPDGIDLAAPPPAADAVFVFSSGTTGMPKAVRHTHGGFAAAVRQWRLALALTPADRMQILTPPSHTLGLLNIVTAIETGAWMRLHRRFEVDAMLETIARDRITIEMCVAPIALALAAHPGLEDYDLSSLRYMIWGATPFAASVAETITRRSGLRWVTAYGASELPVITCNPLENPRLDTVGPPVDGVDVRIVSGETGDPLPSDVAGEIEVRSPSLMVGYLPESANAEVFRDGWYRTGDIGKLSADGYLSITDRSKEMIKVRGFQVAPAEVEAVLHAHPAVADCAAFGVPDADDGEAVIVAVQRCGDVDDDELIATIGDRLASYKRPRAIVFVDQIPRLASGKVLRRVLKNDYMQAG